MIKKYQGGNIMHVQEQIDTVTDAYNTYVEEENPTNIPFFSPTYGFQPNPKAKEALEGSGFVHRAGEYGVGYYADNVE